MVNSCSKAHPKSLVLYFLASRKPHPAKAFICIVKKRLEMESLFVVVTLFAFKVAIQQTTHNKELFCFMLKQLPTRLKAYR
mmetsp:Transcript_27685/g.31974  ORF Transcript_27685/g.31974 Transcript_27685/m.31974 type:complete len:81 (-) Transcript_27685:85-327(-)